MRKLLFLYVAGLFVISCGGCVRAIAAMSSPTQWEIKVPAEYKLADNKPQKMLVLVEQRAWGTSEVNMRLYLMQAIETLLADKVGIKAGALVSYRELADLRNNTADFSMRGPAEAGKALNAQMVLYVAIDNLGLYELGNAGYYKGQMDTRSGLYDVASGQMLWSESGELKTCFVGFEVQQGQDKAAMRLAQATAKCIVRNFYDCPKPEYRVMDEQKEEDLKKW
jgi:hypothetical protein